MHRILAAALGVLALPLTLLGGPQVEVNKKQFDLKDVPNVLFVTFDTTRAAHLLCYGYVRDTSPTIDELATHGALFENA